MWVLGFTSKHINQDTLSEYLDGRLRGGKVARVERELQGCSDCRQALEELRATVAMVQQLPLEIPRRSFVMSAPPPDLAPVRQPLILRAPNWVYAGAASVAALALVVVVALDATGGLDPGGVPSDFAYAAATARSGRSEAAVSPAAESPDIKSIAAAADKAGDAGAATVAERQTAPAEAAPQAAAAESQPGPSAFSAQNDEAADEERATAGRGTASQEADGADSDAVTTMAAAPEPETAPALSADDQAGEGARDLAAAPTAAAAAPAEDSPTDEVSVEGGASGWWRVVESLAAAASVAFAAFLALGLRASRRRLVSSANPRWACPVLLFR